jgi:hypothetical protein
MKRLSESTQTASCAVLCLLLGACGEDAPTNPVVEERSFTATVHDGIGDALFSFVDLDSAVVTVNESGVVAHVTVASLPPRLTFNRKETLPYQLEYCWAVGFDLNNDRLKAGNLELRLCNLKLPGAGQSEAEILEFAEGLLWQWDETGTMAHSVGAVEAGVNGNTITLRAGGVSAVMFETVTESTPLDVVAYHTDGVVSSWDWADDRRASGGPFAAEEP